MSLATRLKEDPCRKIIRVGRTSDKYSDELLCEKVFNVSRGVMEEIGRVTGAFFGNRRIFPDGRTWRRPQKHHAHFGNMIFELRNEPGDDFA